MTQIEFIKGDITEQNVDAIVNAANPSLLRGGGVCGAIFAAADFMHPGELDQECAQHAAQGIYHPGESIITGSYGLGHGIKWIIHTIGPIWRGGYEGERLILDRAYRSALYEADNAECQSIAFPSISTGIYGYPIERAAVTAIDAVLDWFNDEDNPSTIDLVRFVLFSDEDLGVYKAAYRHIMFVKEIGR